MKLSAFFFTSSFMVLAMAQPEEMKPDSAKTGQPNLMSESQCLPSQKFNGKTVKCDEVSKDIVGKKPIKLPSKKKIESEQDTKVE